MRPLGKDGGGIAKYMGRSKGVEYMLVPVRPKRRSGRLGVTDIVTHGLEGMACRLRVMGCLAAKAHSIRNGEIVVSGQALVQWRNLQRRFRHPTTMLKTIVTHWAAAKDCISEAESCTPYTQGTAEALKVWVSKQGQEMEKIGG